MLFWWIGGEKNLTYGGVVVDLWCDGGFVWWWWLSGEREHQKRRSCFRGGYVVARGVWWWLMGGSVGFILVFKVAGAGFCGCFGVVLVVTSGGYVFCGFSSTNFVVDEVFKYTDVNWRATKSNWNVLENCFEFVKMACFAWDGALCKTLSNIYLLKFFMRFAGASPL
ncbi:transmembrane protein, putative [Medicago truncatula]|uniref:Transmembrane protein, putative n=1 Tax=Medicago truncatula TaxID=3880 RepID=A0A072TIT8_MEDTR|nr:transmembrane protein, putative [Medicago truncatula]